MARYLRIAAAVFFALLALGFVALWVRSYYWTDLFRTRILIHNAITLGSDAGVVDCRLDRDGGIWGADQFGYHKWPAQGGEDCRVGSDDCPHGFEFVLNSGEGSTFVSSPHWFLAASSLALAALFAFKRNWRFSLRGLFIATTLVAAILGLAVYAI